MENEIKQTRSSGLGSSDAERVLRISRTGKVSESDMFRLAVMLGIEQPVEFSAFQTELGHKIEDAIFEVVKQKYEDAVSNPFYRSEEISAKYGFGVFNHIDFEAVDGKKLIWIENKATIETLNESVEKYKAQLSWHWMLLREKANAMGLSPHLIFSHYDTNGIESIYDHEFESNRLSFYHFVPLGADKWLNHNAEQIKQGLEVISDCIHDFEYSKREELTTEDLPDEIALVISGVSDILVQIKDAEKKVEDFKAKMCEIMRIKGIKSIKTDAFQMTYVPESARSSFDSKEFAKQNPAEYEKFLKVSQVKEQLKITLKK